jgi:RNA polymerase sigma factor (sigma-70 family)
MVDDAIGRYLDQIGRVPLLTADEEKELARQIEAGREAAARRAAGARGRAIERAIAQGEAARDRFIRANLRLAVSIARQIARPAGLELGDLIQEANLGLEHAVEKFDWRKGFKFSTYATWWIRQAVSRAVDQQGSAIRLPADRAAELRSWLKHAGPEEPLPGELVRVLRASRVDSLDRPPDYDSDVSLGDLVAGDAADPADEVARSDGDERVRSAVDTLDSRARTAVVRRFGLDGGEGRSYVEIGDELGITAESARRLVQRALVRLRGHLEETGAAALLDLEVGHRASAKGESEAA